MSKSAKENAGNAKENGNAAGQKPDSKRAMDRYLSLPYLGPNGLHPTAIAIYANQGKPQKKSFF